MQTDELLAQASALFNDIGPAFYFDPETLAAGKALGLDGFRFYFLGRGGVLGDVEAPVVASAFGYWNPELLTRMWETGRTRIDPRTAGRAYLACCQDFGRRRFGALELSGFCAAAEAVNSAANPAGLTLYAGLSAEPLAEDTPGRAMQLTALLRELRGSAHLIANVAVGLDMRVAHFLRRPDDQALFGWPEGEAPTVTEDDKQLQAEADALTERLLVPVFAVLGDDGKGRSPVRSAGDGGHRGRLASTLAIRRLAHAPPGPARSTLRPMAKTDTLVLEAAGREVEITHPGKVFFPERGDTKADLARYYLTVTAPLMAAMRDRPVLLQRFPNGVGGSSFFQKRVPDNIPDWLATTVVSTPNGTTSRALVVADVAHVLWAVNLGCLGFHVWPSTASDPDHADELRIDLDPTPGVDFAMVREAALEVRALFHEHGVDARPKTTATGGYTSTSGSLPAGPPSRCGRRRLLLRVSSSDAGRS